MENNTQRRIHKYFFLIVFVSYFSAKFHLRECGNQQYTKRGRKKSPRKSQGSRKVTVCNILLFQHQFQLSSNPFILLSVMATGGTIDLCSVCENSQEEEKSILKCSGVCEFTCHLECSTLKKDEHKVLENTNFGWSCDKCKIIGPNINRLIISLEHAVISCQNEILKQSTTINNQNREIKKLTDGVKGLKEHLKIKQAQINMQGMTAMSFSLLENYNQKKDEENQSPNSSQNNQVSLNKTTNSQAVKKPTKEIEERDSGDSGQKNKKKPVNNTRKT
jgi:hypothetical protein